MSVFGLVPRRIGGIESFARELSVQLAERDWRSILVFTGSPTAEVERYLGLPNVSLEVAPGLSSLGWPGVAACAPLLGRYRPSVFHFHFLSPISPFPWLARLRGTRKVFFTDHTSHTTAGLPPKAPLLKRLGGRLLTWPITGYLGVSRYALEWSKAVGHCPPGKFDVLYNGVVLPSLDGAEELGRRFRARHGIPADRELVVQVASLAPEKGTEDLLEAARLVLRERPGTHFAFVGDGKRAAEYREWTRSAGLESAVSWTGLVSSPVGEGAYAAADVVCLASRWYEAFALSLIEGMSVGRPVVATAVGGNPEALEDGVDGYLVPRQDPPALAARLLRLLEDAALRRAMGEHARRKVEERFTLSTQVSELLRRHYRLG